MKTKLINLLTAACLLLFPILIFGQKALRPTMGTTENFVLFTSVGALSSTGASQLTLITGDVSSDTAPLTTNLGNIDGTIYTTSDAAATQCTADLNVLYDELYGLDSDYALPTSLGGPIPIPPGVYANNEVTTLSGNLILDADGNPDALFIFIIKAPGTFPTSANSSIELINGAQSCNVFWLVEGAVSFATGTIMKGTVVSAAAISFEPESELKGRALTKVGAISINNGVIGFSAQKPIGCGSPVLNGPSAPDLATAGCFALFTSSGSMVNSGTSTIVGDVGSNTEPPSGFDEPTTVDGTVHEISNDETAQTALDLSDAFDYLVALPHDIVLLAPLLFGYNLSLTPHTYLLDAATLLTDNLYLDAQGNPDAVFVIKVNGAFSTDINSKVLLINGAKAENVYWHVIGAVSIEAGSFFEGTIIVTGAVELKSTVELNGRALTRLGNFSTVAITAISPGCCTASEINLQPTNQIGCEGCSVSFTVEAKGTDITYQWRKGTVDLDDLTENTSGVTTAKLTFDPVDLLDAATDYNVVITGDCAPVVTSSNASLTISGLPVEYLYFQAEYSEPVVRLRWATASEINNDFFTIEKSLNGIDFKEVKRVQGAGTTSQVHHYHDTDPNPYSGISYYRIKQTDFDGSFMYSGKAAVNVNNAYSQVWVSIYPNPFNVSLIIKLYDALIGNKYELIIYNVLGEVVMKTAITGQISTIETGNIRSGVYLYKVMENDITIQSGKMIKQK